MDRFGPVYNGLCDLSSLLSACHESSSALATNDLYLNGGCPAIIRHGMAWQKVALLLEVDIAKRD
jgi:hypothetical protein